MRFRFDVRIIIGKTFECDVKNEEEARELFMSKKDELDFSYETQETNITKLPDGLIFEGSL